nr:MAG TPA: Protein of unknown function (DUF2441) [Caudoviricetes sp.]
MPPDRRTKIFPDRPSRLSARSGNPFYRRQAKSR